MFKKTFLAMVAVAALATPGAAQPVERGGVDLLHDVGREVRQYTRFTIFDDVNASIENGVVRLTGKVTAPFKREDIAARVGRIAGVTAVENEIGVLPVSPFDDDLRVRIARAIYGNSAFWHYGAMANPPIHIVVEHGRVTLTGVVNSNVERMLARSIATTYGAFSVKNDLKTDAEVKDLLERVS
jgi:hyperosmotically inducible protein